MTNKLDSDTLLQVMLLNTVKDVCGSLVGLLIHAKNANGQQLEHPAFEQVSDYSKVRRNYVVHQRHTY